MKKAAGLLAAMTMVLAACGGTSDDPGGGIGEAIAVHGDWTIDVYDEDGSLDQHVEFSNALTDSGRLVLELFLTGQRTPSGFWSIRLRDLSANELCAGDFCDILDIVPEQLSTGGFVVAGSTTVEFDGVIDNVFTGLGFCPPTVAPADCTGSNAFSFTAKGLDAAAAPAVSAGQTVQVEVEISFG